MPTVLIVDAMAGVREGLRWVLAAAPDIVIAGEAATVAGARGVAADVVLSGLRLPDGTAAELADRPLVVHTWLPPDERDDASAAGARTIVVHGRLRDTLAPAIRAAAAAGATTTP